jgi:putative flippase GtrA
MVRLGICAAFTMAASDQVTAPERRPRSAEPTFSGHAESAGLLGQFTKFIIVGTSNTAISFVAYAALIWLGVFYWLAGAIAFALGAANGYMLNRRWTFASPDTAEARLKYLIVQLAGLGATTLLLWLLVSSGALARIGAYAVTVPAVTLATFLANRGWVFRHGPSFALRAAAPRSGRRSPERRARG